MGMDVYVDGTLTIPSSKVLEAGQLLLAAVLERDAIPEGQEKTHQAYEGVKTPEGVLKLIERKLERFGVTLENDGSLEFGMDDSCRHEEYDQWLFEALAPAFADGEFYMSGDDYRWKWVIEDGEFYEQTGETLYDYDREATPTIEKLVVIIYPNGKPITATPCDPAYVLAKVENLLREAGYGPQAGMNELDRLAQVADG
jgi:hypothetical protein